MLSIWAHLGQSNHPARQHQMLGFVVRFAIQNLLYKALAELLSIWPCQNISHIQVKLFTSFFPAPPHKTKTGIVTSWETINKNSLGPISLCDQWTRGVRLDNRGKVRKIKFKKYADPRKYLGYALKSYLFFASFLPSLLYQL